jgi:acyl-CoA thioester hydrolase
MTSTESVTATNPFTIRRRARFGDCDPAGVVYTVRFSDYVVSAMDLFLSELLAGPHLEQLGDVHTPIKALNFVFQSSLRPNDEFDMVVEVRDIRTRTFDLAVVAKLPSGVAVFEALVTPICVTVPERRSTAIPGRLRTLLEQYQERTGSAYASTLPD